MDRRSFMKVFASLPLHRAVAALPQAPPADGVAVLRDFMKQAGALLQHAAADYDCVEGQLSPQDHLDVAQHELVQALLSERSRTGPLRGALAALKNHPPESEEWIRASRQVVRLTGLKRPGLTKALSEGLRRPIALTNAVGRTTKYDPFAFLVNSTKVPLTGEQLMDRKARNVIHGLFESLEDDDLRGRMDNAEYFREFWQEDLGLIGQMAEHLGVTPPRIHLDIEAFLQKGVRTSAPYLQDSEGKVWSLARDFKQKRWGWSQVTADQLPELQARRAPQANLPTEDALDLQLEETDHAVLLAENAALRRQVQDYRRMMSDVSLSYVDGPDDLSTTD